MSRIQQSINQTITRSITICSRCTTCSRSLHSTSHSFRSRSATYVVKLSNQSVNHLLSRSLASLNAPDNTLSYLSNYNQLFRARRYRDLASLYFIQYDEAQRNSECAIDQPIIKVVLRSLVESRDKRCIELISHIKQFNIAVDSELLTLMLKACEVTANGQQAEHVISDSINHSVHVTDEHHASVARAYINAKQPAQAAQYIDKFNIHSLDRSVSQPLTLYFVQTNKLSSALSLIEQTNPVDRTIALKVFRLAIDQWEKTNADQSVNQDIDHSIIHRAFNLMTLDRSTPIHAAALHAAIQYGITRSDNNFIDEIITAATMSQSDLDEESITNLIDYFFANKRIDLVMSFIVSQPIFRFTPPTESFTTSSAHSSQSVEARASQRSFEVKSRVINQLVQLFGSDRQQLDKAVQWLIERQTQSIEHSQSQSQLPIFVFDLMLLSYVNNPSFNDVNVVDLFNQFQSICSLEPSGFTMRALLLSSIISENDESISACLHNIHNNQSILIDLPLLTLISVVYLKRHRLEVLVDMLNETASKLSNSATDVDFSILVKASRFFFETHIELVDAIIDQMNQLSFSTDMQLSLRALSGHIAQSDDTQIDSNPDRLIEMDEPVKKKKSAFSAFTSLFHRQDNQSMDIHMRVDQPVDKMRMIPIDQWLSWDVSTTINHGVRDMWQARHRNHLDNEEEI